jgi:alkaline phosphatase
LTQDEVTRIKAAKDQADLRTVCTAVLSPKLSAASRLGFTTGGHTGEDVVLYAYDPNGTQPTGVIMNTDIARYMEKLLETDLVARTGRQFQKAAIQFSQNGAIARTDFSSPANPVLVVKKGNVEIRFPQNKNLALVNGKEIRLSGLVLYTGIPGGENWYVPQDAVALVK